MREILPSTSKEWYLTAISWVLGAAVGFALCQVFYGIGPFARLGDAVGMIR
jgi:hypothetical protein